MIPVEDKTKARTEKSGRGLPHSESSRPVWARTKSRQRLGVRQSSAAFPALRLLATILSLAFFLAPAATQAAPSGPLLLDAARADASTIVAVGERGLILRYSATQPEWTRVQAPETPTLCGVTFATAERGWAAGHGGIILATTDGGATWEIAYRAKDPETSFLDVLALDAQRIIAIGGFGTYLESHDRGQTWRARRILEEDTHLNRLTRAADGTLFIAGEAGTLLRSRDHGGNWEQLETDNEASFYGVLPLADGALLAYGLRGRVYRSEDDGDTWEAVPSGTTGLLLTGAQLEDGTVVLAGQARTAIASRDGGRTFLRAEHAVPAIAELLPQAGREVFGFGEAGVARIDVP